MIIFGTKWMLRAAAGALLASALSLGGASAQTLSGKPLSAALQSGGYVIVFRHANAPQTPPTPAEAEPDNPEHERQLDSAGREAATAIGTAIKALHIPMGEVLASPLFRAQQTVRYMALTQAKPAAELAEPPQGMQAVDDGRSAWLKSKAAQVPAAGTNTALITHYPNIFLTFGAIASGLGQGEALVFHPDGNGATSLVARIKVEDWAALAGQ